MYTYLSNICIQKNCDSELVTTNYALREKFKKILTETISSKYN